MSLNILNVVIFVSDDSRLSSSVCKHNVCVCVCGQCKFSARSEIVCMNGWYVVVCCLQCFDAVGWVTGRASGM